MDDSPTREYALYLRKSRGRAGIARQRTITGAHIESVGGVVAAEFADVDRTAFRKVGAARPERERYTAMLAWLRGHPGAGIAAWHADRITRDIEVGEELIQVCVAGRHLIETPSGGTYDLSTATGRKRLRQDALDAVYEVDHMTERITAQKAEAAANGEWRGGRRPFGYERDGITVRPAEADVLAAGIRSVIGGQSLGSLARQWNGAGIATTTGGVWVRSQLARVLQRARNAGLIEHDGQVIGPAQWKPVVSEAEWRAVCAVLADPDRKTSPGPDRRWLGSGIYLCGVCRKPLVAGTVTSPKAGPRTVYRCRPVQGQGGPGRARAHVARDAATLDDWITRLVIARLSRPDAAAALEPSPPDVSLLHAEIATVRAQLDGLAAEAGARKITARQLAIASEPLNADLQDLQDRLAAAARPAVLAPFSGRDAAAVWEALDLDRRRAVISLLMAPVIHPAPKGRTAGWRPGQPYFHADSVDPGWKTGDE